MSASDVKTDQPLETARRSVTAFNGHDAVRPFADGN
jgi:hypothetical protein